jgi:hypothetical protein
MGQRVLSEPGGLQSKSSRTWSDAAGRHSCVARLTAVSPSGVVLHRTDGAEARVAFSALSDADLHFVQRQIRARQMQLGAANATFAAAATQ